MSLPIINSNNENLNVMNRENPRIEREDGFVINKADALYLLEKQMMIDPDTRRRVTFNIVDGTFPQASSVNALLFSLKFDSQAKFISTTDTTVPFARLDADNTPTNLYLYLRRSEVGTLPLVDIDYLEGGIARTTYPVNSVQGCVQSVDPNTIHNPTTLEGVNGWKLADVALGVFEKTRADLLSGKRLGLIQADPTKPVQQMALVLGTADTFIRAIAAVHVDVIEMNI